MVDAVVFSEVEVDGLHDHAWVLDGEVGGERGGGDECEVFGDVRDLDNINAYSDQFICISHVTRGRLNEIYENDLRAYVQPKDHASIRKCTRRLSVAATPTDPNNT